ncbi:MAG: hypothetical protein MJ033_05865 [Victivallaceae bacterium]|nr:hypothetical protein [Victivallaceae bacterium]
MKKLFLVLALCAAVFTVGADSTTPVKLRQKNGVIQAKWSPFQFSLFPGEYTQLVSGDADIYGLALSVFAMEQKNTVLTFGLTSGQDENCGLVVEAVSLINKNYGLDISAVTAFTGRNYGVQISVVNIESYGDARKPELKEGATGLQIGLVNVGQGFQIGVFNYNPDAAIPLLPLINFPTKKTEL